MAHFRTTHLKWAFRAAARHSVVGLSIVAVTFSGNLLALPALAESGPPPEPLSVAERSVATDPERFYLPALSGTDGWASRSDGFWESQVGDARVIEPEPTLLPQGSFVPYRVWDVPGSVAIEFPSHSGSQMVRFSSTSLSYELSEHAAAIGGYIHIADQRLSLQYRSTASEEEPSPSVSPAPTPELSDEPTPSESPTATPEEPTPTETPIPEASIEPTPTAEPSVEPTPEESADPTPEPGPEEPLGLLERARQLIAPDARAEESIWESAFVGGISMTYDLGPDAVTVHHRFTVLLGDIEREAEVEAQIGFTGTPINKWTYAVEGEAADSMDVRIQAATTLLADAERTAAANGSQYTLHIDPAGVPTVDPLEDIERYRPEPTPEESVPPAPTDSVTPLPEETVTPSEAPSPDSSETPSPKASAAAEPSDEPTPESTPEPTDESPAEEPTAGLLERLRDFLMPTARAAGDDTSDGGGDSLWEDIANAMGGLFSDDSIVFTVAVQADGVAIEEYDADNRTSIFTYSSDDLPGTEGYLLFVDPSFGAVQDAQGITVQSGDGSQSADFKLHFNPAYGGSIDELYQGGDFADNRVAVPASVSGGLTLVNIGEDAQASRSATLTIEEASSVRVIVKNELPGLTERYSIYPSGRIAKAVVVDATDDVTADFYLNGRADAYDAETALPGDAMQLLTGDGPDLLLAWQDPAALASASLTSGSDDVSRVTVASVPLPAGQHTFYQLLELSQALTLTDPTSYLRYADDYRTPDEPMMTRGIFLGFAPSRAAYQFEAVNNVVVFRLDGNIIPRINPVFEVSAWSDPDLTAFKAQLNGHNMVEGVDYAIGFKNGDASTGVLLFQYLHTIQQGDQFNVEGEDLPPLFDLDPSDAAAIKRVQRNAVVMATGNTAQTVTLPFPVVASRSIVLGGDHWGGGAGQPSDPEKSRIAFWLSGPTTLQLNRQATGSDASVSWQVIEFEDNSGALVQRGSTSWAAGTISQNITLPTAVNTNNAFAMLTVRGGSTDQTVDEQWTVRASLSATTLNLTRNEDGTEHALDITWQVVQLSGVNVQRGLTTLSGATGINVTIGSVDRAKSFIVSSARGTSAVGGVDSQYQYNAQLANPTTLRFSKTTATNGVDIAWFVVTFTGTSGPRVRRGAQFFTATTDYQFADVVVSPSVIATRSGAFTHAAGGTAATTSDLDATSFGIRELNSAGTSLRLARFHNGTLGTASVSWEVTEFTRPAIQQNRYRWRNDDGTEVTATALAAENASASLQIGVRKRLRFGLFDSDTGSATNQYRLEFTRKVSGAACTSLAPGWAWRQVPVAPSVASDAFDMEASPNLTDAAATTNAAGVLTDDDTVFVAGETKESGSQTSSIGLASTSFTEIEYSLQANSNAVVGNDYCFRLTDAGEDRASHSFIFYPQYAQAEVSAATTFTQDTMRWYANLNDITVVDPWTPGTVTFASTSFTTAGTTVFAVPAGVTSITVKAWGAGGGGGEGTGGASGGSGGGGGFAQAILSVTPAENLNIDVGTGGAVTPAQVQRGGDGGGYSAVRRGAGTFLVQAAGGGGGGAGDGAGEVGGNGGAGGGTSGVAGQNGGPGNNDSGGGGAGTQSAGGAGGDLGGDGTNGTAGAANAGGNGGAAGTGGAGGTGGGGLAGADPSGGAGGGGGGRFGGGGGEDGTSLGLLSPNEGGAGGGGGSSGFGTSAVATVNTAGSGTTPGNNGDAYYGGTAGIGGAGSTTANTAIVGNPGRVVISYVTQTSAGSADITESDNEIYAHWAAPMPGTQIRLRMNVTIGAGPLATSSAAFTLQFAELPVGTITCPNVASWTDMGASTSSSNWRYGSNTAVTDGTTLPTMVLSTSDVRGSYEEFDGTASNSFAVAVGQSIEYDFSLQNNTAAVGSRTCFRLRKSDGTALTAYSRYPSIVTQPSPTNEEMLMRHGDFFTVQGDEQPYYWAEIY